MPVHCIFPIFFLLIGTLSPAFRQMHQNSHHDHKNRIQQKYQKIFVSATACANQTNGKQCHPKATFHKEVSSLIRYFPIRHSAAGRGVPICIFVRWCHCLFLLCKRCSIAFFHLLLLFFLCLLHFPDAVHPNKHPDDTKQRQCRQNRMFQPFPEVFTPWHNFTGISVSAAKKQ